jgi:glycosyltransferase involved in cell wall biosynthesis
VKFLIVTFDPPQNVGGVEGRARAYTQELLRRGHLVELASFGAGYPLSKEKFFAADLTRYPSSIRSTPRSFRSILRSISSNRLDSIFLLSGALTLFGMLVLFYARLTGKKSAIFLYGKDILEARTSPFGRIALFVSLMLSRKVATNSRFTASLLPKRLSRKISFLYPGVDPRLLQEIPQRKKRRNSKTVLFVGRLVERKGVDDLLHAFKLLLLDLPDVELEIVGDGPDLGRLKKLAQDLGVDSCVRFLGELHGVPLFERYSECDVFVMPSRRTKRDVEGFGTVFLEAGLFSKPSVGTFSGGIPEAVLDGKTGLLVAEGDVEGLKRSLLQLLSDEKLNLRFGAEARRRVLSNFTWEKATDSLVSMFADS